MKRRLNVMVFEPKTDERGVFSDPQKDFVFTVNPGDDAKKQIEELEEAFCLAEQRLGTFRAG